MGSSSDSIWLLIPAYRVADQLGTLLALTATRIPPHRTIVVDDGSPDDSAATASLAGVNVMRHTQNMGKGEALKSGFREAMEKGAEWIITMDGDLQHDPEKLSDFISASTSDAALIIGRRDFRAGGMPLDRRFSNRTSSLALSLITGVKLFDVQCGYRMYRAEAIRDLPMNSSHYDLEIELLLRIIRRGGKVGWVDIPTIYGDRISSIHRGRDTLRFIDWWGRYLLGKI